MKPKYHISMGGLCDVDLSIRRCYTIIFQSLIQGNTVRIWHFAWTKHRAVLRQTYLVI